MRLPGPDPVDAMGKNCAPILTDRGDRLDGIADATPRSVGEQVPSVSAPAEPGTQEERHANR